MATSRLCSIPDCGKPHYANGWCGLHYQRHRRHGDPLGGGTGMGAARAFLETSVLTHRENECLIWPFSRNQKGYAEVNRDGVARFVHRIVCEAVYGPAPSPRHEVAHSCGNGHLGCVAPRHLRWATYRENRQDMIDHERSLKGRKNPSAILTENDVRAIRRMRGRNNREIGDMFGVHPNTIGSILHRRTWSWLD